MKNIIIVLLLGTIGAAVVSATEKENTMPSWIEKFKDGKVTCYYFRDIDVASNYPYTKVGVSGISCIK